MQENTKLIKIDAVCAKASIKPNHVYVMIRRGLLPKPVKLGKASRWYEHEIDAAIAAMANRREVAA